MIEMKSDDSNNAERYDSDSGESRSSFESELASHLLSVEEGTARSRAAEADSDSEDELVVIRPGNAGLNPRGRGRSAGQVTDIQWTYLEDEETDNPVEWKIVFDRDSTGIKNVDFSFAAGYNTK